VNFLDDHSRVAVASRVLKVATAPKVLEIFGQAGTTWGLPAALLTDNGCVYTTWHRGGPNVMQTELLAAGIDYRHSRPYHPQTCGKVERFHQTLKRWLAKQQGASSILELQGQVDRFVAYYNEVRPHRAVGRRPPRAAFDARDKARPSGPEDPGRCWGSGASLGGESPLPGTEPRLQCGGPQLLLDTSIC
jgi:transposase InsO family protein